MSKIKSLILGSAAGLVAVAGAQAADLPVKAKAVQYVKICSLYGAGFYYIPGTETCLKVGGYAQFDVGTYAGFYDNPHWAASATLNEGSHTRDLDNFMTRTRFDFILDARTATEYGVVRAYNDTKFQFSTNGATDGIAGGTIEVDNVFVQFAGFTFGKAASAYSTPWHSVGGNNNTSSLIGGHDNLTGTPQISYTWQFGNGVSAQLGVEDPKVYDRSSVLNTSLTANSATVTGGLTGVNNSVGLYANSYGGNWVPDVNGNIRVDNAAFTAQISAAMHYVNANYFAGAIPGSTNLVANEVFGHPSDKVGYAVQGGFQIKNLPTGPGDKFTVDVSYAKGANRYILGGTTGNNFDIVGGANTYAFAVSTDSVYTNGSGQNLTTVWGARAGFVHNWNAYWESDLFGSYTKVDYNTAATGALCTMFVSNGTKSALAGCNPDFALWQVGTRLAWTPVQNLTLSAEAMYNRIDQNMVGTTAGGFQPGPLKAIGVYTFKDQGTYSGNLRIRRTF